MDSSFPHIVSVVPGWKLRGFLETPLFQNIHYFYYSSMLDYVKKGAVFSSKPSLCAIKKYREVPEWIIALTVVENTDAENWT